ncbi:MAG: ABC transporter ATP-binding protein [Leptolinea sp.]|jgi:iron complex transport system ATP-binding protein|nr:ABC transporter ATP-binding protein [Leptolinea sp.]
MSQPILSLEHISYSYDGDHRDVLKDLNLEIIEGSVTALLGPNGAGKSTLLHVILGWLPPREGLVKLNGRPLHQYSRREAGQMMALVPQIEHMPFDYSILEYVLLGRTPYLNPLESPRQNDLKAARHALAISGLSEMEKRTVTSLSGGERQLVLLARALTQQPRIILLDEPTSHLDLANKARLIQILRELHKAGSTIVLTTHEPEAAAAISTQIVLLRAGKILISGQSERVFTAENLTRAYGVPVRIVQVDGQRIALWT